jgi:hypothetical protein
MSENTIDTTTSISTAQAILSPSTVVSSRRGREVTADYNEINILETDEAKSAKLEMWIAKRVGEHVANFYPNRQWRVDVDLLAGMLILSCPSVSSLKGYYLSLSRPLHDLQARAKMAAGEILERHGLPTSRAFNPDAIETLPRNIRDEVVTSDSAPEPLNAKT